MTKRNAPLSRRQHEVLGWIRDGCPDGVWTDFTYKTTSYSLRDRGLVLVSKKNGVWRAEITPAGETYLNHGQLPVTRNADAATGKPSWVDRRSVEPSTVPSPEPGRAAPTVPGSPRLPAPKRESVSAQLIADILAAGGELVIDTRTDKTNYRARISRAIRAGRVPAGKLLTSSHTRNWYELVIRLGDPPAWMIADLAAIPVPGTLRRPLPLIAALRDDADCLPMKAAVRNRALRLVQALAAAGAARGYRFDRIVTDRWGRSASGEPKGLFSCAIGGHRIGVSLIEPKDKTPHLPTRSELKRAETNSWIQIPAYDHVASGRLSMSVTNGTQYRQSVWTDGAHRRLEDCLPEILQELELRADDFEKRHQARLRERETQQRQWQEAFDHAKTRMAEAHRADVLIDQLERWQRAGAMTEYLRAMEEVTGGIADAGERTRAEAWLTWARQYTADIDPLGGRLAMPAIPAPTAENLKPFLGHLSFYGPEGR